MIEYIFIMYHINYKNPCLIRLNFAIWATCSLMTLCRAALYWSNCCGERFFMSTMMAILFSSITPNILLLSVVSHSSLLLYKQMARVRRASTWRSWSLLQATYNKQKIQIIQQLLLVQSFTDMYSLTDCMVTVNLH